MFVPRFVKDTATRLLPRRLVEPLRPDVPFDNSYRWLNETFTRLVHHRARRPRPAYVWGVAQAAALARVLEIPRMSVLELGVAGGCGLLALESVAEAIERLTGVEIDVVGFDSGVGLPKPEDVRDQPNLWVEGQMPMDRERLESALGRAMLRLGPVGETIPAFVAAGPPPVGFVAFDLDLYSSTRDALVLLRADHRHLLPRVVAYFDDIFGLSYNDFGGERLAIREFNELTASRKICPIHGLRYFGPRSAFRDLWPDGMHFAHIFDHPSYGTPDSIQKGMVIDIAGSVFDAVPGVIPDSRPRTASRGREGR